MTAIAIIFSIINFVSYKILIKKYYPKIDLTKSLVDRSPEIHKKNLFFSSASAYVLQGVSPILIAMLISVYEAGIYAIYNNFAIAVLLVQVPLNQSVTSSLGSFIKEQDLSKNMSVYYKVCISIFGIGLIFSLAVY